MSDQRLKGQEVSIRIIQDGVVVTQIDAIMSFNDNVNVEMKQQGYLGETVDRFDDIFNGYGGDMEFHPTRADWELLVAAIIARATRANPLTVFNVVRTDFFPNGDTNIYTYQDVFWGPIPTNIPSRGDYVKPRMEFGCSARPVQTNALP